VSYKIGEGDSNSRVGATESNTAQTKKANILEAQQMPLNGWFI